MKTALKATLASAVLMSAASVVAQPASADGHAGSVKDFGYVAPRAAAGPCYIRGDVGYAGYRDPDVKWPVNNITRTYDTHYNDDDDPVNGVDVTGVDHPGYTGSLVSTSTTFAGDDVRNVEIENTWFGEVGIGCGSGSRGFRAEAVFGFRGTQKIDGEPNEFSVTNEFQQDPNGFGNDLPFNPDDPLHTNIQTYTAMFNMYYDLGKFGRFVPYVGAGVGIAYHRMDEVYFTENTFLTNRIEGNNDITFAWSLMAGTAYQISDRAILDIGYRYSDLGQIKSGRADNAGFVNPAVKVDDLTSHEIKVGLRYHFGSSAPAPVAYEPMK